MFNRGYFFCSLVILVLFGLGGKSFSQNTLVQVDSLEVGKPGDTLWLSHFPLSPFSESIWLNGKLLAQSDYVLDPQKGYFLLKNEFPAGPLVVQYRYFRSFFQEKYAIRGFHLTQDSVHGPEIFHADPVPTSRPDDFFVESSELKKSGSISRGITVGNNQSLSVQSGLRMQVEGDLGDGLKIAAAITDENIPIQPDGTSQQIQDFDKVFIKVAKKNDDVILGDFEINHTGTQFANFYRNVQGIGVHIKEKSLYAQANAAVAKGKFHTNSFSGQEGVQGPYRLTGRNNERFIIVLAGSEKVFVNGELMQRGEGNDYTIDYNTGELTFTAQRLVSSASRIVVDFEYSDQYFNRSLLFGEAGNQIWKGKVGVKFSYGRDADNHNAPLNAPFSNEELDSLRAAGDDLTGAFVSGVDSVGPSTNPSNIQYARRDTLAWGNLYERYVYSNDPDSALFRLSFSYVGPNKGYYQKDQNRINGTVFKWVGPDSLGIPLGDYSPVKVLPLPRMLQVADLRLEWKLGNHISIFSETAVSSEDKNRLSELGDEDNGDIAQKGGIVFDKLKIGDSLLTKVELSHRYVGLGYQNIDRVYKVEYGREWNFNDLGQRMTENVSEAATEIRYGKRLRATGTVGIRSFGSDIHSFKQAYALESSHRFLQGKLGITSVQTADKTAGTESTWIRTNSDIYKNIGPVRPGIEVWLEDKSLVSNGQTQTGAFAFQDYKPYIKSNKGDKFQYHLSYNYRQEREFWSGKYRDKSLAHTGFAKWIYNPKSEFNLQNTSTLRRFQVLDTAFISKGLAHSQTLMNNLQSNFSLVKRMIVANLIYEASSEQVARKDAAFIEVNAGQGQYEWIDADSNGIQGLDEFQLSTNPLRANFIRVLVPTRTLFPTTALNLSGNLKVDLKKLWAPSDSFRLSEIPRNFLSITNFRVSQKKESGLSLQNYWIQFGNVFADTNLLEANYTLREDIYFFRNHPVGEIKLFGSDNKSKLFLSSGDEWRGLNFLGTDQRVNFGKSKSIENQIKWGSKLTQSAAFPSRNYHISFVEWNPKLNFQISRKIRLTTGYELKTKSNQDSLGVQDAKIRMHKIGLDARWNLKERNNIFVKFDLVQIRQNGNSTFSAEYELRESLQPGFNALWQVYLTYYLNKSLEISVNYDGRASEGNALIHSGRVQLKAYF